MESKIDLSKDGNNPNFYECNTTRIGALTKMVLDRENIAYTQVMTRSAGIFQERYYVQDFHEGHWLQNKAMLLEFEIETDAILRAQFEYQIAFRQLYIDQRESHG